MSRLTEPNASVATEVLRVDPRSPDAEAIHYAAQVLRAGGLVAFPTETVYGLGADATSGSAVAKIFAAKGRPAANPLIVHVADAESARSLVSEWSETADRLTARFWPGPLTLVLQRGPEVPAIITGGGATVAARAPSHPVARALIIEARCPIAAPSANRSSRVSPTRPEHVLRGLNGRIDLLLDAGPTPGGIESTVLDVTTSPPRLLRPGPIQAADIEAVIGPIQRGADPTGTLRSPGLLPRHYAPAAPLELAPSDSANRVQKLQSSGICVGWLPFGEPADSVVGPETIVMPAEFVAYAAGLYSALHELESRGVDRIVVELPPDSEEWLAIRDRLARAASPAAEEAGDGQ